MQILIQIIDNQKDLCHNVIGKPLKIVIYQKPYFATQEIFIALGVAIPSTVAQPLGGLGAMAMPPLLPLQFLNQTRSNSFSFKHQRFCNLWVFKNYKNQEFFIVYAAIFGQYGANFIFQVHCGNRSLQNGLSGKVLYLMLDLLKSFLLSIIQNKTTRNEILSVRLQLGPWTY